MAYFDSGVLVGWGSPHTADSAHLDVCSLMASRQRSVLLEPADIHNFHRSVRASEVNVPTEVGHPGFGRPRGRD